MGGQRRSQKSEPHSEQRHSRSGDAGPEKEATFTVELTETAEATYRNLWEDGQRCLARGDESNSKVKLLRIIEDTIDRVIPSDPFNTNRALSGLLSNIFRVKKGRLRICYVASSKQRCIVILYISETPRKEGDVHDPYSVLTRLVESGEFDKVFAQLGVRQLAGRPPTRPPAIQ
jgi:mRNA-degrading endonuclease RelE of RelBE toxin-antitoxin system